MRKKTVIAAALACMLSVSLAPVTAMATSPEQSTEAVDSGTAASEEAGDAELQEEPAGEQDVAESSAEAVQETVEGSDAEEGAGNDSDESGEADAKINDGASADGVDAGAATAGATAEAEAQDEDGDAQDGANADESDEAGQLSGEMPGAEQAAVQDNSASTQPSTEESIDDSETEADSSIVTYTAPENTKNSNVSFTFVLASKSQFMTEMTYPMTMKLQEVDTKRKLTLTIKTAGQIMEVPKGDYAILSLTDSGKVPLLAPGDTLHIDDNTMYTIQFAANDGLKTFTNFIKDNVLLLGFFVLAALFYQKIFIPRFASDIRRR